MPASNPPPPSFGELVGGVSAATEVYPAPQATGTPSHWAPTVATDRIRSQRLQGMPSREPDAARADGNRAEADEPERVAARFRSHGRRLFFPTIFVIALAAFTGYFFGWFSEPWQNWGLLALSASLAALFFFAPLVRWLSNRYVVTTKRIVLRHGLFINTRSELLLGRARELTVKKSLLQSMFRSGDVHIGTGLGEFVVLRDVPHADLVLTVLSDLLEAQHVPAHAAPRIRHPDQENPWWEELSVDQRG